MHGLISSILAGVLFGALATCSPAHAEEQPCRRDGSNVVCTDAGFTKLIDATLDFKKQAQESSIRLAAREKDLDETKRALDTCLAQPDPAPPVQRTLLAYAAGLIGTAMTVVSPTFRNPTTQAMAIGVGLVLIGGGAAFVVP